MIGRRLGHFEILAELGAGGMGEVYRALDTRLGREVAVKVLPAEVAGDPARLARFRREARVVAALNHPNVVTIYSVEEARPDTGGSPVQLLCMELVTGQTLSREIKRGPMGLDRFLDLAAAMASAVAAAHDKGITHRDLKPANVMVTPEGLVKVLDFGLAKLHSPAIDPADSSVVATRTEAVTQEGVVLGTVPYMSPEQVEGKPVDHRTDIFSLGIVFYEMATGERPFRGETTAGLASSILKDHPPSVDQLVEDLPRHLGRLIGRCLEKDTGDRYQSARDVLNELRGLRRERDSGSSVPGGDVRRSAGAGRVDLSVGVLPFAYPATDDGLAAIAEGLAEDVSVGLARFPLLRIVDATTATTPDPKAAAAQFGVRHLLRGRLRRAGTRMRCSVHLTDGATGGELWSENYDEAYDEAAAFDLQDRLSNRIVCTVGDSAGVLVRTAHAALRDLPHEELTANDWVIVAYALQQQLRREDHAAVQAGLERAVAREPRNAEAWAWLAGAYLNDYQHNFDDRRDSLDRALQAARRAIDLDPASQIAWLTLAHAHFHRRDLDAAFLAIDKAVPLNPRDTVAIGAAAMIMSYAGRWEEGVELCRRTMAMNPHHPGWLHFTLASYHVRKGQLEEALACAKQVRMPELAFDGWYNAAICGLLGRRAEAEIALRQVRKLGVEPLDIFSKELEKWMADPLVHERLVEGYAKAQSLVGGSSEPPSPA